MKKILIFMLALLLCAGVFASCKTDKDIEPGTSATSDEFTTPSNTTDDKTPGDDHTTESKEEGTTETPQTPDNPVIPGWDDGYSGEY